MTAYRDGTIDDAPAIDRIFRSSFCDTFAHLYRPNDLETFLGSFDLNTWEAELRDPAFAFRIAEVAEKPVGYVKLGPPKLPVDAAGPSMEIKQFYILTGYHGVGIAHELMDWALGEARRRGAVELYLTVFIDNHRARRFYDRYEFEDVGRYDFMVGEQADEDVIMRKVL